MADPATTVAAAKDLAAARESDDLPFGRGTVDRKASFARFVYPFAFDPDTFSSRLETLASVEWRSAKRAFPVWETSRFPESDLLAHVRSYLNPAEAGGAGEDVAEMPIARLLKLTQEALHSNAGLGGGADWSILLHDVGLPFHWNSVSLVLFPGGIGLLVLDATPTSERIGDWLDFIHSFRYTSRQERVQLSAKRKTGPDSFAPFFPAPAGGVDSHPDGRGLLQELLDALLNTARLASDASPWWAEVFVPKQTISYTALFADGVPPEEQARLVYCLRNCFHARQELHAGASDLSPHHRSLLSYAEGQCFVMTLEGGGFVAFDAAATPFFRQTLPQHLHDEYFLVFLLVAYQRFFLTRLLDEIAVEWLDGKRWDLHTRACRFNRLRRRVFAFKARGYFSQAMQSEHHHACYQKWQEVWQTCRLYEEANSSVSDMHQYLTTLNEQAQSRSLDRLQAFIAILSGVIGVPGLLFALVGVNWQEVETGGWQTLATGIWIGAAAMLAGLLLMLPVLIGLRSKNQPKDW